MWDPILLKYKYTSSIQDFLCIVHCGFSLASHCQCLGCIAVRPPPATTRSSSSLPQLHIKRPRLPTNPTKIRALHGSWRYIWIQYWLQCGSLTILKPASCGGQVFAGNCVRAHVHCPPLVGKPQTVHQETQAAAPCLVTDTTPRRIFPHIFVRTLDASPLSQINQLL